MYAYATVRISASHANARACLKGVVDIDSEAGWLGFATVFGNTCEAVQNAAYLEAERRANARGLRLEWLKTELPQQGPTSPAL